MSLLLNSSREICIQIFLGIIKYRRNIYFTFIFAQLWQNSGRLISLSIKYINGAFILQHHLTLLTFLNPMKTPKILHLDWLESFLSADKFRILVLVLY